MGLPKRSFSVAAAATGVAFAGSGGLFELHVAEVTGTPAATTMRLYDLAAGPVSGSPIAVVRLGTNGKYQAAWPKGIRFVNGLLVEAVGGDVNGSILFGTTGVLRPRFFNADTAALVTGPTQVDSLLIAEGAGAVAEATIFDALTATGTAFATVPLAANETAFLSWPQGVNFGTGISVDEVAGAVEGTIYTY